MLQGRRCAGAELALVRWRHVGGANPALWRHAPPLADLRCQLAALLRGRVLVGHHLRKDLGALGLEHPASDLRDTLQYRQASFHSLWSLHVRYLFRGVQPRKCSPLGMGSFPA
jgi:RNA exonuclease 4